MAKKKTEAKIVLERTYNIPLRKEFLKVPRYKRAKKTVSALRKFLMRHMKAEIKDVKIGKYANLKIWERGIKNPPHHIKVNVKKDDEGKVFAELVGAPEEKIEIKKPEIKEEKKEEKKEVKEEKEKKEEIKKFRAPEETEEKKEKDKILTKKL